MKQPYTFEEILLLLERARMDDVSQRLRELWAEKNTTPKEVPAGAHTVGEGMELADEYSYASRLLSDRDDHTRASLLAAIERMASDREVLLSAMQDVYIAVGQGGSAHTIFQRVQPIAHAAIQKVTK